MGIRIHKAMGWCITPKMLAENTNLISGDAMCDVEDAMYDVLNATTFLEFPKNPYPDYKGTVLEKNLLARTLPDHEGNQKIYKNANGLYQSVYTFGEPEGTKLHMFFNSGLFARDLYRYDNSLDYTEATVNLDGSFKDDPCEDVIIPLKTNPYPWSNNIMTLDGEQVPWEFGILDIRDDLVPAPPVELRWWLTHTGILKEDGWKFLRPYFAKWWS